MTRLEFYRVLAPVVAAIKCGHTDVCPAPLRELINVSGAGNPLLPLYVRVLEGKLYVLKDFSGQLPSLVGKELRSVNGVPSSSIIEKLLAAARGDGDIQSSRMFFIGGWRFSFQLFALMGMRGPYEVILWDSKEKREIKARLAGADVARLQDASGEKFFEDQRPETAARLKFLDGGKIAVMSVHQFSEFVGADRTKKLAEFFQESFGAIREAGTETLILDVRNNGGGADELGKLLLSYLLDKPFKYYDDLVVNAAEFRVTRHRFWQTGDQMVRRPDGKYRMVKHPNWGLQEPSKPTFAGKVYILINGGSFSTTAEFLSHARFHKRATFIGEESGGGYYGNTSGEGINLTLPNTKVYVRIPQVSYRLAVGSYEAPGASHGVLPDHLVQYSIEDVRAGTDKELTLALELARRR